MRKLALFILLIVLALAMGGSLPLVVGRASQAQSTDPVVVISSTASQLAVGFDAPEVEFYDMRLLDGADYTAVGVQGVGSPLVGQPQVPIFGRWILVPNGATPQLVIDSGAPTTLRTDMRLNPVQPSSADVENPVLEPFVRDAVIYSTDADFPGVFARLGDTMVMRGQEMALLWLYPYQYNPVQARLTAYPNLNVIVNFEGVPAPIPDGLESESFDKLMRHLAINANEVLEAESESSSRKPMPPGPIFGYDYLIITPPEFLPAANKLANWREKSGLRTLVEVVSENLTSLNLKEHLESVYDNWTRKPEYILLLGDAEFIPPSYKNRHPLDKDYTDVGLEGQGLTGTDLYYSLLHSKIPFLPEDDLMPDVELGRISIDTLQQAEERVQGIINYEQKPSMDYDFYNTAIMAAYFQDGSRYTSGGKVVTLTVADTIEDKRFVQTTEDVAIFLSSSPRNKNVDRQYYAKPTVNPTYWNNNHQDGQDFTNFNGPILGGSPTSLVGGPLPGYLHRPGGYPWIASAQDLTLGINGGAFLVTHRDHGSRMQWGHPEYLAQDVKALNNKNKLPVVWSLNCETGWFDNETDFNQPGEKNWTGANEESFA